MRSSPAIWIVFVVLGFALWLSSLGFSDHTLYRMALALACTTWAGYVMWSPKETDARPPAPN